MDVNVGDPSYRISTETGGSDEMSSLSVLRDLASFFLPIGYVGASIAVLCAIVAAVALARGAAGLAGGAVGCWIVGAVLSLTAGFAGLWWLVGIACAALVAALVLGPLARAVIRRLPAKSETVEVAPTTDTASITRPRSVVLKPASQR